ncbi:MAG: hypothetical protein ACT4N2_13005 [Hyphomicrobium sp.]
MLNKLSRPLMATALVAGVMATTLVSSIEPAEARRGRGIALGVAAGIIGLGVAAAIANDRRGPRYYYRSHGGCYPGPEQCGWSNRRCFYNNWGDYVCRGGRYTCWRPTYCD